MKSIGFKIIIYYSYRSFYDKNLTSQISVIRNIADVKDIITDYLYKRIEESEEAFEENDEEDWDI